MGLISHHAYMHLVTQASRVVIVMINPPHEMSSVHVEDLSSAVIKIQDIDEFY